ncbi:hypothetical protein DM02DRAFT_570318 [Periconia macrospinosa]|uniref:Rhodopsin domain-containing protein n=1 Tax=Periconia macrospinosa TaxID=97972 RepID=A0A2V1DCZ5_9PLEO|nr:hypothetical protein DM02DRAFT_570318 [Periconia macrospinosa]
MALPPPPPGLDLTESRVPQINGALISTFTLATVAISLRLTARHLKGNPIWTEDWLAVIAWVASGVHCFISISYMVPNGTGKHVWVGPPVAVKAWASGLFVSEIAYTFTIACVKWSTLLFYWRIFSAKKSIRLPIFVLAGIVSAWAMAVILVTTFQCLPPHAFWQRYDPINPMNPKDFKCGVVLRPFFYGNSVPNIITDGFIVLLPLPYVWQLQLHRAQKIAVGGIFALGAFVTLVSIIRLSIILTIDLTSPDITFNFNDAIIWTNIEANTAIICACLPALKPLLSLALKGTLGSSGASKPSSGPVGSKYASKSKKGSIVMGGFSDASRASRGPSGLHKDTKASDDDRPFVRLNETDSTRGVDRDVELQNLNYDASKTIMVTRQFSVGNSRM